MYQSMKTVTCPKCGHQWKSTATMQRLVEQFAGEIYKPGQTTQLIKTVCEKCYVDVEYEARLVR